ERRGRPARNVTMLPYRRDSLELAQWIASADALVHAGTKETFGLVILEAMACGRPVVAARAGAFPEFVDERVGVLAEPNSAFGMAEAIVALYDRDLETIGAAARERVLSGGAAGKRNSPADTAVSAAASAAARAPCGSPRARVPLSRRSASRVARAAAGWRGRKARRCRGAHVPRWPRSATRAARWRSDTDVSPRARSPRPRGLRESRPAPPRW